MKLAVGYELTYQLPQPTPMLAMLHVHPSRRADLLVADTMRTEPAVPVRQYQDGFGNLCARLTAPAGRFVLSAHGIVKDAGRPDPVVADAGQHEIETLPDEALLFLLGSRYCETDRLTETAWTLFGDRKPGWALVQAICEFVHGHIKFDYAAARPTRTALEAYEEKTGVCRDYAHLAVAFCRALNVPARYCTGYLSDIGEPHNPLPMDFAGWFEAYLDGAWHMFDPRNLTPRRGRVLVARGRDATDVALTNTFGPNVLEGFKVWTEEAK